MNQLNWCFLIFGCPFLPVVSCNKMMRQNSHISKCNSSFLIYKDMALVIIYGSQMMRIGTNGSVFFWTCSLHLKHHKTLLEITCPWGLQSHGSSVCCMWHHSLNVWQPLYTNCQRLRCWEPEWSEASSPCFLSEGDKLFGYLFSSI